VNLRVDRKLPATIGLILIPSLLLFGCLSAPPLDSTPDGAFPAYGLISPQQAVTVLNTMRGQPDFVLLDVRTAPETAESHISGTVGLDFYSPLFRDNLAQLEREITYLIYCRTGNRTGQTMALIADLGFEKTFDLDGGIRAWTDLGYPVCAGSLDAEHSCSGELP
jgi:rhodanese-related sulfurtransferase